MRRRRAHRLQAPPEHRAAARRHRAPDRAWRREARRDQRGSAIAVVALVGATTWGATLAALLGRNGHDVTLIARTPAEADQINATRRLSARPEIDVPDNVRATPDPSAIAVSDALLVAVPSQTVRENARRIAGALPPHHPVVHATKGLEHATGKRVSEMLLEELAQLTPGDVCALSGPNLAGEIARGLPATTVVASASPDATRRAQALLHSPAFRVYTSTDLVGVELGGALKNVIALAAGVADGLGVGDNAKAGIITRGLAEITRLGVAAGARANTFAGLAGAGDLIATCYSPLSRNRRCGEALGRGASLADAIAGAGGVVEGVDAMGAARTLARRYGVDMPIADALHAVLFEGASLRDAIARLLERDPRAEDA